MLAKNNRLLKHGSFAYVYAHGKRLTSKDMTLIYLNAKTVKIGFSVSNKVGKAVVRNKVKRRLRAFIGGNVSRISGCQAIFVAGPSAAGKSYDSLASQADLLLTKAGLIK